MNIVSGILMLTAFYAGPISIILGIVWILWGLFCVYATLER